MYTGTKNIKSKYKYKFPKEYQLLTTEEILINGVIQTQLKFKTITQKNDPNISVWDFNILNLARIGAMPTGTSTLTPNLATLERQADQAGLAMDRLEMIQALQEYEQQLTTTTQTTENNGE